MQNTDSTYKNITSTDVYLASVYFPILIDRARNKAPITYTELVNAAKDKRPDDQVVLNAIPVSTGRRLDVVRLFAKERNLPDITSLVVNQGTGECGSGFTDYFNPEEARNAVYAHDWHSESDNFTGYIQATTTKIKPRKKIKPDEAKELMYAFYKEHKSSLPGNISQYRDYLIDLIMEGFDASDAFQKTVERFIQ